MSPRCCCESRHSPLLIWCVSRRSAVTELQRDKGASYSSQTASRGAAATGSRGRGVGESLLSKFPHPHMTEDRKLHYSGQKGTAETLPPKNPEEERAQYRVTAVLPSLLSREHSDLLHNGLVGKLFSSRQSSSPDSYQYKEENTALPLSARLLQTKTHT